MESTIISLEALKPFFAQPSVASKVILKPDDIKLGEGKGSIRRIFEGDVTFDEFEKKALAEYKKYLEDQKEMLSPFWTDPRILRFLQASQFNHELATKWIRGHTEFRKSFPPPVLLTGVEEFLQSGCFYLNGRDRSFRPIIVIVQRRLFQKKIDPDVVIQAFMLLLKAVEDNMFIPGKIENWIIILDLKDSGITNFPLTYVRTLMEHKLNTYRGNLHSTYAVNAGLSVYIPWNILKHFLPENTRRKIMFTKSNIPEKLFESTSRNQIEQQFGGTLPDRMADFWPPKLPEFDMNEANISRLDLDDFLNAKANGR